MACTVRARAMVRQTRDGRARYTHVSRMITCVAIKDFEGNFVMRWKAITLHTYTSYTHPASKMMTPLVVEDGAGHHSCRCIYVTAVDKRLENAGHI